MLTVQYTPTTMTRQDAAARPLPISQFQVALDAINAAFVADCADLKARYPGKRSKWPPEALKDADAIQARFDEAIDHLFESCSGQEVQS